MPKMLITILLTGLTVVLVNAATFRLPALRSFQRVDNAATGA